MPVPPRDGTPVDEKSMDAPTTRTPPLPSSSNPGTARTSSPAPGHSDAAGAEDSGPVQRPPWTLLTNHGHVLLAVARSQDARVTEIAAQVGITTRATLTILKDLEDAGYLTRHRVGRRSHYTVDTHQHFRHPATASHEVGELLAIFAPGTPGRAPEGT